MKLFAFIFCFLFEINGKKLECEVKFSEDKTICVISYENLTNETNVMFGTGNFLAEDFNLVAFLNSTMVDVPSGIFSFFHGLQGLVLLENGLTEWKAKYLKGGLELILLRVADNLIKDLPAEAFVGSPHLMAIEFSNNQIAHISPNAFLGLESLEQLRLNGNRLGPEIKAETFLQMPKSLEMIDLSRNSISSFEPEVFKSFKKLEEVFLYENNFEEFDEKILPISIKFFGVEDDVKVFNASDPNKSSAFKLDKPAEATKLNETDGGQFEI